jgi:hypothetical protein
MTPFEILRALSLMSYAAFVAIKQNARAQAARAVVSSRRRPD